MARVREGRGADALGALLLAVASRRSYYTARTTLWITCGWIGAALLAHWIVRRVPTHVARELTLIATGAVIGLRGKLEALRLYSVRARS